MVPAPEQPWSTGSEPFSPTGTVSHPRKLAARVARQIEADIARAGWPVGTVFGAETELRERYGVSRAVFREAIRLVEHHEVAIMRRGPSGGLIVRAPDFNALTNAMVIYLEYVGTSVDDLLSVRRLLEPLAARLAAERMTEEGIAQLRATLEIEKSSEAVLPTERDLLHTTIAQLSGNSALRLFVDVLSQLTMRYAQVPRRVSQADAQALADASDHAHAAIVDAISAGDATLAERRVTIHLEAIRDWFLSVRQRPIGRLRSLAIPANGKQKLAEIVARRLMLEILERGAHAGDVIGSESDLLAVADVSRAVLREAIRLLEYHSVARMKRGPGGGLVVTEPDPTACIEAMAIYLDYQKIMVDDLREVRDVIELGALNAVVSRYESPHVKQTLLDAQQLCVDSSQEQVTKAAHHFHTEIAELSENTIIALFLKIITTVWARHTEPDSIHVGAEAIAAIRHSHERIVAAILAGDISLAQYRMRKHLSAMAPWWH